MQQKRTWIFAWVVVASLGCFGAGVVRASNDAEMTVVSATSQGDGALPLVQGLPDFSLLVEAVGPSVVNIRTQAHVRSGVSVDNEMTPEMREFYEFFFGSPAPGQGSQYQQSVPNEESFLRPSGVGSGFIISADGYIMTNAHVVMGADEIIVTLSNSQAQYHARVIGVDRRTDVALVKIDGVNNLPFVRIGDVNALKVGEWVVAIGSPFGLDNSVTAGIVSAKQRDTGEYVSFIQSDVAINPGNSGGPLINMRGEVVGINNQIYSRSGGFMGVSFSIPIDEAMYVARQLQEQGYVERGRIGVLVLPVSREVIQALELGEHAYGALVSAVVEGSPADRAGLLPGDVITEVNGQQVQRHGDLPRWIGNLGAGVSAEIKFWRMGEWMTVRVVVDVVPTQEVGRIVASEAEQPDHIASARSLGVQVRDLTDEQKRIAQIDSGVLVVSANNFAMHSGLNDGNVILAIGRTPVRDVAHFNELVEQFTAGERVVLLVRRNTGVVFITMQL